jgi:hypothetical protein
VSTFDLWWTTCGRCSYAIGCVEFFRPPHRRHCRVRGAAGPRSTDSNPFSPQLKTGPRYVRILVRRPQGVHLRRDREQLHGPAALRQCGHGTLHMCREGISNSGPVKPRRSTQHLVPERSETYCRRVRPIQRNLQLGKSAMSGLGMRERERERERGPPADFHHRRNNTAGINARQPILLAANRLDYRATDRPKTV